MISLITTLPAIGSGWLVRVIVIPVEALAIGSNERVRMPRLPLSGDRRKQVEKVVKDALATRPNIPALN